MPFAQPLWLIAGLLFCLGFFVLNLHLERKRSRVLEKFAAGNLLDKLTGNISRRKRTVKLVLLLAAIFFCFAALARPQYGHRWIDVKRKGIDILFAIDTSASMMTRDIRPNRLARAKFAILDFVAQLEGDRVGLMPFAGTPFLMCPLTIDYAAFEETLQAVDTDVIPEPGTNLAEAIDHADSILDNDANHKLLIIVTDGENLEGDALQAAEKAAENGMTIFTVGVGTAEGELVPAADRENAGFIKDESGQFVISRLDESSLKRIASLTGGLYAPLGDRGEGLEKIYQQKLQLIPKEELMEKRQKVPIERFPWFLGTALVLLTLEFLLGGRKNSSAAFSLRRSLKRQAVAVLLPILLCSAPMDSSASPGEEAFTSRDFPTALEIYRHKLEKQPDDAVLNYNYGTAAYKNDKLDEAIASFDKALRSDDLTLQEQAYFNRGNAQYRTGEHSLKDDPQKTIAHWQNALDSYKSALELAPDNERARHNLDLVQKKLDQLQQQQQQQGNRQDSNSKENARKNDKGKRQQQENGDSGDNQKNDSGDQSPQKSQEARNRKQSDAQQNPGQQEKSESSVQQRAERAERQQPGRMTKEEAVQLLKEMENQEGTLRFVPQPNNNEQQSQKTGKNW